MLTLGPVEIIIIAVIVLIFFGAGKLGDVGGALGKTAAGLKEHGRGSDDQAKKHDQQKSIES